MSRPLPPVPRDGLTMAKLCAKPGCCLFCEEPLAVSSGRHHRTTYRDRWTCGSEGCKRAYNSAWRRDRRCAP